MLTAAIPAWSQKAAPVDALKLPSIFSLFSRKLAAPIPVAKFPNNENVARTTGRETAPFDRNRNLAIIASTITIAACALSIDA